MVSEQHTSFAFKHHSGSFTARHERQRNGWYWYAYRKRDGHMHKTYLGRPAEMSMARLTQAATTLSARAEQAAASQYRKPGSQPQSSHVILNEKFTLPTATIEPIERPQLFKYLTSGVRGKLVLITAPAGWGKTTLLSDWCGKLQIPGWSSAWISLDSHDNDPRTFWSHILTALNIQHQGIADQALALLRNVEDHTIHTVLKTFLNACQQLTGDIILLLDNYQAIQDSTIQQTFSFFLDHLPARLHVVIASRTSPPLPLARLRVQGALTEIRSQQLRFSLEETDAFFKRTQDIVLDANECAALTARTEGWVAGLQLASLSMQDKQHVDIYLNHNRYIRDYLVEEVFQQQTPELQQFLLQTSIINRLNSALCDEIRQASDSQSLLEQLERANLCLSVSEQPGHWYSYPQLLQETLQHLLQHTYPHQLQQLHQRASQWHEQQGQLETAIYHATQAEDAQTTHRLLVLQTAEQVAVGRQQLGHTFQQVKMNMHAISAVKQEPVRLSIPTPTPPEEQPTKELLEPLTRREQEVLQLLVSGASNREIAQSLVISEGTVKKHVFNICSKLGVQSRGQAMAKSIALALL
ncbi:LuxR family transcriptional regulator [Dictyobacter kobayashii]|uniref:HTH luxR-type domain-containing protein n=1 Tax=Dictyobacter kobayashii TaxID=2014872 RepID=A0A402AXX1_9CHLR|nr:LuxR family transcriptional regulator [Dictyobacter kobayashii]GCE23981.1 hypothetical protein KDK_77810 [Dictyobacter kobayashii]